MKNEMESQDTYLFLVKGITPKIRMLCFALINRVLLNLLCVWRLSGPAKCCNRDSLASSTNTLSQHGVVVAIAQGAAQTLCLKLSVVVAIAQRAARAHCLRAALWSR